MKENICDFCAAPDPEWEFPAESFFNEETQAQSTGAWLACEVCAALVCMGAWERLARRAPLNPAIAAMIAQIGPDGREVIVNWARRFHQQFKKNRAGEPVRVKKGVSQ